MVYDCHYQWSLVRSYELWLNFLFTCVFSRSFSTFTMSVDKDISALLAESAGGCGVTPEQTLERALQEVERLMPISGESF